MERAYADDTVQVTIFDRKSIYCFGTVKHALYYSPILVARNIQVALRWYRDHGMDDPWDVERICRPDFELRLARHLEAVGDEPAVAAEALDDSAGDGASDESVEPSDEAALEESPARNPESPQDIEIAPVPGLNRARRRAAERQASKQRLTKPPKPPPASAPPPEIQ